MSGNTLGKINVSECRLSQFINRLQEISFLIDELERLVASSPDWAARLDLEAI